MQIFTDCIVPEEGYRNDDGYIRVLNRPRKEGGKLVMLHRLEWEKNKGPIPDSKEINHLCLNRECCNLNHLECIDKSFHKSLGNSYRFKKRADSIFNYYLHNPDISQKELASLYGITQPGVNRILKRYKEKYFGVKRKQNAR